jgi:hypothetical protein
MFVGCVAKPNCASQCLLVTLHGLLVMLNEVEELLQTYYCC